MNCKKCNSIIKDGYEFCVNCGEKVVNEVHNDKSNWKYKASKIIGIITIILVFIVQVFVMPLSLVGILIGKS